jgi:hypothetical protein
MAMVTTHSASGASLPKPGFRAVSIFPAIKDGHPVTDVTLTKGEEWKTVFEKLD